MAGRIEDTALAAYRAELHDQGRGRAGEHLGDGGHGGAPPSAAGFRGRELGHGRSRNRLSSNMGQRRT